MARGSSATSLQSVQQARKRLTEFIKTVETKPVQILEQEAIRIQREAKRQTPRRTGKLEKSVYVRVSKDKRRPGLLVGASATHKGYDYAAIQHENTRFRHPIKGKAYYLLDPYKAGTERIIRRLRKEIKY